MTTTNSLIPKLMSMEGFEKERKHLLNWSMEGFEKELKHLLNCLLQFIDCVKD